MEVDRKKFAGILRGSDAGIAQLVEHDLAKVGVASSSLVSRSRLATCFKYNFGYRPGGRVVM